MRRLQWLVPGMLVACAAVAATVAGVSGGDAVTARQSTKSAPSKVPPGFDYVRGTGGSDTLGGVKGGRKDYLDALGGDDLLKVEMDRTESDGGSGYPGAAGNVYLGGAGDDTFAVQYGLTGATRMDGGAGQDVFTFSSTMSTRTSDDHVVDCGAGYDVLIHEGRFGGLAKTPRNCEATLTNGSTEHLHLGTKQAETLHGDPEFDLLAGLGGDDRIFGSDTGPADYLDGGEGHDFIDSGAGAVPLLGSDPYATQGGVFGGPGNDVVIRRNYASVDCGAGQDVVYTMSTMTDGLTGCERVLKLTSGSPGG